MTDNKLCACGHPVSHHHPPFKGFYGGCSECDCDLFPASPRGEAKPTVALNPPTHSSEDKTAGELEPPKCSGGGKAPVGIDFAGWVLRPSQIVQIRAIEAQRDEYKAENEQLRAQLNTHDLRVPIEKLLVDGLHDVLDIYGTGRASKLADRMADRIKQIVDDLEATIKRGREIKMQEGQ